MSLFIQNPHSGNVIDIQGNSTAEGALLDAYTAKINPGDNPANQQWEFVSDSTNPGYYFIENPSTKHVIDIQGNSTLDGASLDAYPAKNNPGENHDNQLWQIIADPAGSGYFFIQNKLTGHVIDVSHNSTSAGALLDAFPLKLFGNANQLWAPLQGTFPPPVKPATPPSNLGGFTQYVLSTAGTHAVPLKNITVTIDIIEDIVTSSLSVQVNGFAPATEDQGVDWQQYGVRVQPTSNQLTMFANNWPPNPTSNSDDLLLLNSSPILTLSNNDTIPRGFRIVIQLINEEGGQNDGAITGVTGTVFDSTGKQMGTPQTINLNQSQKDLAPLVAFQVCLVGWANQEHAQLTSGMGTITCLAATPLTPSIPWPSYSGGANGTAESSNCFYGLLPAQSSLSVVQSFGVANPTVVNIQCTSQFVVTGSGFLANDLLTLTYALEGGGSGASEDNTVKFTAASDGSFSCTIEPPNFPGPEFAPGTVVTFGVTVRDQSGNYALANCQLDTQGTIANFNRGQSGPGNSTLGSVYPAGSGS
jgi:hypothetical protein